MSQNTIIGLQAVLIFFQIVNTGIAIITKDPLVSLMVSAGVGALQYYVNHVGIHSISPEVKAVLTETQKEKLEETKK